MSQAVGHQGLGCGGNVLAGDRKQESLASRWHLKPEREDGVTGGGREGGEEPQGLPQGRTLPKEVRGSKWH